MAQSRGQELIDRLPDVDLVIGHSEISIVLRSTSMTCLAGRSDKIR
jgi:hypothetical protein